MSDPYARRFERLVDRSGECWLWMGHANPGGYGVFPAQDLSGATRTFTPHRVMWERRFGPIPEHHHLHHRCGVKLCVRPDHCEPLTPRDHFHQHLDALSTATHLTVNKKS